jgi:hypothetical protein
LLRASTERRRAKGAVSGGERAAKLLAVAPRSWQRLGSVRLWFNKVPWLDVVARCVTTPRQLSQAAPDAQAHELNRFE